MSEQYPKNSLLGQLETEGFLNESQDETQYLPFGILTGTGDVSPFCEPVIEKEKPKIMQKRLNELDNNLFQEGNFIDIDDVELTSVEKIKKIKRLIKNIDEKIFMLEDSEDEILIQKLKNEKEALSRALALLDDKSLSKMNLKEKIKRAENFIFKFFPPLRKNFLVRHALNKLVMLNESAKELTSKKIPYGESEGRYNDFIAYLNCANVIHAKLTKKI